MRQKIRLCLIGWVAAWLLVGCGQAPIPTDAGDEGQVLDTPPVPGKLSGRLTLDLGVAGVPILDAEPNDTIDYAQTVGQAQPGTTYVIQGEIGNRIEEDTRDSFRFITQQPVEVSFALEFSGIDLNLGVMNFRDFLCTPKPGDYQNPALPNDFSHCFTSSSTSTEAGSFTVEDVFDVVVVPVTPSDRGQYVLTLVAAAAPPGSSFGLAKAGSGEGDDGDGGGGDDGEGDEGGILDDPNLAYRPGNVDNDPALQRNPHTSYTPAAAHIDLGRFLVSRRLDGISMAALSASLSAAGFTVVRSSPSGWCLVDAEIDTSQSEEAQRRATMRAMAHAQAVPGVARTGLNYRRQLCLEPVFAYYYYLQEWHMEMIGAEQAWDLTTGSSNVTVAILDTGIDSSHPDLSGNIGGDGYDFYDNDSNPADPIESPTECFSHGTFVAGIIGANAEYGMAGVNWDVNLMPLRVGNAFFIDQFAWTEALRYAAGLANSSGRLPARAARVANLSFGRYFSSPIEEQAVADAQAAGLLVVASAGNDDTDLPSYPSSYSGVVSVAAVGPDLQYKATYSNYGSTITLTAPGGDSYRSYWPVYENGVWSTSRFYSGSTCVEGWESSDGTSFSAPHVAGVAGLMLAVNPTLTVNEMRSILINTAIDLGAPGEDDIFGAGLVNASGAVREAARQAGTAPTYPALALDPEQLTLGQTLSEATIDVSNAGSGLLRIENVETLQRTGGTKWLYAYTVPGGVSTNVDSIVVHVDRRGLQPGRYLGAVVVREQNRGQMQVPVIMDVGEDVQDVAGGEINVIAVDPDSHTTVAWTTTTPADNYEYRFESLPPGDYYVYAGSDGDGDGQLCEFGEVCGAYGTLSYPVMVSVTSSAETTDVDIALDYATP